MSLALTLLFCLVCGLLLAIVLLLILPWLGPLLDRPLALLDRYWNWVDKRG